MLKEVRVTARQAAVKKLLTDEHKLHRLEFAACDADRLWDRVIFSDESTYSSGNDGACLSLRTAGRAQQL
jgi:hypothetical protein